MKLLGMDVCLCGTVFPITASQKGFPMTFYSGFAAYKEHDIMYKGTGMYSGFKASLPNSINKKGEVYSLANYLLKVMKLARQ